jgi:hypothetical protein
MSWGLLQITVMNLKQTSVLYVHGARGRIIMVLLTELRNAVENLTAFSQSFDWRQRITQV